ncbi:LacI family DNA-binding transcriptional regulator [Pseudobacillus badius]|uniref:LacI family DNA-binding transcriptional regulator n=1 Tax=Bacillus badius TaxID=1455 RepID=UPI0007B06FB3|nr:LacI family DNA-binding transcriptional regulator [Bacillus badius]KZN98491.1 LacI family transcriptional regulator [Bacillus badius]MED0666146.1 LacI family DNA-binding transcriptional regulator [Bacillus badius]OCS83189.1 LacI family transcriptional regulator [Bacillus badius]OVE51565.1 LacI family transcriptional regulator [Bacillus badius]TDW02805.1 LacI family transcriptional regulator [Bacillus badius]
MKTIADIAKLAGVAKSTVSRYLNGGSVSEQMKKRLEAIIEETGYTPNTFAQSLKAKKTNMIGTIVPGLDSYETSQILAGIDNELRKWNSHMLVSNTNQNLARELELIYRLAKQKVAGIILLATEITEAHLQAFEEIAIPVLLVGQQHEEVHSLVHNDEEAGYAIGKYIIEQGHRRLAFLGVSEQNIAIGINRKEGFKRAVREANGCEVHFFETGFTMKEAAEGALAVFEGYFPSALICATDDIAIGAVKAAYQKGMHVPANISVTGFGGYSITEMMNPALTTVKLHFIEAGEKAARHIIKLANGEDIPKLIYSGFEIIARESVDKRFAPG